MIIELIVKLLTVLQVLLVGYFVLSWFPQPNGGIINQLWTVLDRLFAPILNKMRKVLPSAGMFDLSGIVLLFAIIILQGLLTSYI
jgi:YggT family protein